MFSSEGLQVADTQELTKQEIRLKVWNYLHEKKLAKFPLPVYNRIPNFEGAAVCGQKLSEHPVFISAQTLKVNPDKPQEEVRFLTLQAKKKLLVPSPRLKNGLFNLLENDGTDNATTLRKKSQSEGVKFLSKPVDFQNKLKVELIVLGSVAVSITGRRIGKGEGFADLEYAMMKTMGVVDDEVLIITTVHDCQVFDDLAERLFREHDVPIDIIVTPTRVIDVTHKWPKPQRIYWNLLSQEKLMRIPILKHFYELDMKNGVDVKLMDGELSLDELNSLQDSQPKGWKKDNKAHNRGRLSDNGNGNLSLETTTSGDNADVMSIQVTINVSKQNKIVRRWVETADKADRIGSTRQEAVKTNPKKGFKKNKPPSFSIFIGGIPRTCRPHDLKSELASHGVRPSHIAWKGGIGVAFLNFNKDDMSVDTILKSLEGLSLKEKPLKVDVATKQKHSVESAKDSVNEEEKNVGKEDAKEDVKDLPGC